MIQLDVGRMMLRRFLIGLFLFYLPAASAQYVTYDLSGGRFGDNLLAYLHAKWFAYQHDLPLLYKPFEYSNELCLDDRELAYGSRSFRKEQGIRYWTKAHVKWWPLFSKIPLFAPLYVCPYFPEDVKEARKGRFYFFQVDWKDAMFRKHALEMLAPKKPLALITPPRDRISIAMHVREGGGFDRNLGLSLPLKSPPKEFYLAGLRYMVASFPGCSFFCHIFTDSQTPELLAAEFRQALPAHVEIEFSYRQTANRHDANVLEDFFSFFNFDLLIRPQSNFSLIPSLLHDYAIVYAPKDFRVQQVVIDDVDVQFNVHLFEETKKRQRIK